MAGRGGRGRPGRSTSVPLGLGVGLALALAACSSSGSAGAPTSTPSVAAAPVAAELVTCGWPLAFPADALTTGPLVDRTTPPGRELQVLLDLAATVDHPDAVREGDWRVLADDGERVVLGSGAPPRPSVVVVLAVPGQERWMVSSSGPCRLRRVVDGRQAADWDLERPAGPADTTLALLVDERDCASGRPPDGRITTTVEERGDAVVITAVVTPLDGDQECPGAPPGRATVELAAPLGDRALLDGGASPPQPPCRPLAERTCPR